MKRWSIIGSVGVLVCGGAAAWYVLRPHDPLSQANRLLAAGDLRGAQLDLRSAVLAKPNDAKARYLLASTQLRLGDPLAAEHELQSAAKLGYDPSAVTVLLAEAALQQRHFDSVLQDYQPTGAMTPAQTASLLVTRGMAQLALGQVDQAASGIAEAQQRDPKSFPAAMAAAQLAEIKKDYPGAQSQVDQALAIQPNAPAALVKRAELDLAAGDRKAALTAFDAAVDHSPGVSLARLGRAELLLNMGETVRARTDLDAILKAQPQNPVANFLLARLLMDARDWTAADAAIGKAAPFLDRLPRGEYDLAVIKATLKQPQQALDAANRYLLHSGADSLAAAKLVAEVSLSMSQPARAVAVLEPVVGAGHADAATFELLARGYGQTDRMAQAIQSLEHAAEMSPGDPAILAQLASARLSQGQPDAAAEDLQRALDRSRPPPVTPAVGTPGPPDKPGPANRQTPAQTATELVQVLVRAGQIDRADAALQRLRQMSGVDPVTLDMLTGLVSLAKFDLTAAHSAFADAAKANPDNLSAQVSLAQIVALQGNGAEAVRTLSALADKNPSSIVVLVALEGLLLDQNMPDQAIDRAKAAHERAPTDARLTLSLVQLYARTNHLDQALALLSPDAGGPPPSPQVLELQARLQVQARRFKDAADTLRKILAQRPNDPAVTRQLIDVLLLDNDVDHARGLVRNALAARPGDPAMLAAAVAVAARQDLQAGLAKADELVRDKANLPAALPLKGDLLMSAKQYPEAAAAYRSADQANPSSLLTVRTALAQQAAGKPDAAATVLRDWLASHPDDADAAKVLASLDISAKRLPQARDELNVTLKQQPNDPIALNNLAWVEQQSGDLAQARQLAQHAYLLQPTPQVADTLGWIIFLQNDAADALPLLRQAAAAARGNPSIQYHLAAALAKTGRREDAVTILKALDTRPDPFDDKDNADKLLATLTHP